MNPARRAANHAALLTDGAAFEELVKRHHRAVYRTALAIVRSPEDAEDVAQNSWLQASRHLGEFQGAAAVRTWLLAIARNEALSHRRAIRRRLVRDLTAQRQASMRHEQWQYDHSPESQVLRHQRGRLLADEIQALSDTLRIPLCLWHTGNYSYRDIGRILGVSCGTIKSRIWDARQQIHAALQGT